VLETTQQRDEWVEAIASAASLTHERTPSGRSDKREPVRYAEVWRRVCTCHRC
jgi:hypothetical protein